MKPPIGEHREGVVGEVTTVSTTGRSPDVLTPTDHPAYVTKLAEAEADLLAYVQQLATVAAGKVGHVPEWKPLDDVLGCLTQIDNCLTGLSTCRDACERQELIGALKGVVAVADRQTVEFDRARAAIAKAEGRP